MERVISGVGLFVMMGLAWAMSSHRTRINWRVTAGGVLLQIGLALLVLRTGQGRALFQSLGELFAHLLSYSDKGAELVFGRDFRQHFVAFSVLPTIIFFSALMSVLYHFGVMQLVVRLMAILMQWTLGTSGAETLSASANIFVGQTEAPLMIRPYIAKMTRSELMAVMVGGFSTIAGGVMAMYVGMGIDAGHLMTASVISAPASLVIAKLLQPETEVPETSGVAVTDIPKTAGNVFEAAASGASDGLKLALNVGAMLLAFTALMALADGLLEWCGGRFGQQWSLGAMLGHLFRPLALVMGISWEDSRNAGELLGLKMVANELVAYERMSGWMKSGSGIALSERSVVILTYALCGFSNFASIGIQLGGIGGLVPERRSDLAAIGFRAMLGGTLACCMTACIAGVLL